MLRKIFVILFLVSSEIIPQVVEDSIYTELDSLLLLNVEEEDYLYSASKYFQTPSEVPLSISIIKSNEIELYSYHWLTDLLQAQNGFYISDDRNYSYLGIRGFGRPTDYNNRILLMIDDHIINDPIYYGALIGPELGLSLDNIERVEIVRGPGSILYGSSAMFGTINLVTKKNTAASLPQINIRAGNFNTLNLSTNYFLKFDNDFSFQFNGNYYYSEGKDKYFFKEFNTPENNNGIAENLDGHKSYGIHGKIDYKNITLAGFTGYGKKDIPTASWEADFNKREYTIDKNSFIRFVYNIDLLYNLNLKLELNYDAYRYNAIYFYDDTEYYESDVADSYDGGVQLTWDIWQNNRMVAGYEYKNVTKADYKYSSSESEETYFDAPYMFNSFYIQDEYQINNNLLVYLGFRYLDYKNIDNSMKSRAGLVYSPSQEHTFKFLYGNAFRTPTIYEREYADPLLSFIKNPNISSEEIISKEISWEYKINRNITSSLSLYENKMYGLIEQVEDGEYSYFSGIGKVTSRGLEFENNIKITPGLNIFVRYSHVSAKEKSTDAALTNSPMNLLRTGATYYFDNTKSLAIEYLVDSKRKTVYRTNSDVNHLVNANITWKSFYKNFDLYLTAKNLFNSKIEYPGGYEHIQPTIIQPGRRIFITLSIRS